MLGSALRQLRPNQLQGEGSPKVAKLTLFSKPTWNNSNNVDSSFSHHNGDTSNHCLDSAWGDVSCQRLRYILFHMDFSVDLDMEFDVDQQVRGKCNQQGLRTLSMSLDTDTYQALHLTPCWCKNEQKKGSLV